MLFLQLILEAAIRDIHTTIDSRYPLVEKISISTLVQGINAKNDIIEKIKYADTLGVDTIILGRGGGSIEDLWNFNEEEVVRAIYECHTPIISAVGHETDFTLSDFVADMKRQLLLKLPLSLHQISTNSFNKFISIDFLLLKVLNN